MTEQAATETIVDISSAAKGANFLPWLNRTAEQLAEKLVLYADSVPQRLKPD
jgi:hypothetical protein